MNLPVGLHCPSCDTLLQEDTCHSCGEKLFKLGDVFCASRAGQNQIKLWQHQLHSLQTTYQQTIDYVAAKSACVDLVPATRNRYQSIAEGSALSAGFVLKLFSEAGLEPAFSQELAGMPPGFMQEYYTHILRDWAWTENVSGSVQEQLRTVLDVWPSESRGKTLVIGSGAGRVAWDLHCALSGEQTIAFDLNPLLQLVANRMTQGDSELAFPEVGSPREGFPHLFKLWPLKPSENTFAEHGDGFSQLVGDIWQLEFEEDTFDFIMTSWFIDAHGRDNREFIEKASRWLKPGGYWINTGPLLYPDPLPMELRHYPDEIKEFMRLGRFNMVSENFIPRTHLPSPFRSEIEQEEIWTFCAQYKPDVLAKEDGNLPDWMIMHYLPIRPFAFKSGSDNPAHAAVISHIDGAKSINDLEALMRPNLPADMDVKFALLFIMNELLGLASAD